MSTSESVFLYRTSAGPTFRCRLVSEAKPRGGVVWRGYVTMPEGSAPVSNWDVSVTGGLVVKVRTGERELAFTTEGQKGCAHWTEVEARAELAQLAEQLVFFLPELELLAAAEKEVADEGED